jgi:hypothetical protein
MKNVTSSLGSARPSDCELSSSSSSSHLFSDSDIENITKEEKEEEEEEEESTADDFLYEDFMVPNEVIVPSEIPSVPKVPEIIKSHQATRIPVPIETMTTTVIVSPTATVTIMIHALRHGYDTVYGLLLGNVTPETKTNIAVTRAVPVCHGAPTVPIADIATALVTTAMAATSESRLMIVGWYTTAPTKQLLSPVAIRLCHGLISSDLPSPTLLVLSAISFSSIIHPTKDSLALIGDCFQALAISSSASSTNDSTVVIADATRTQKIVHEAAIQHKTGTLPMHDWLDHMQLPSAETTVLRTISGERSNQNKNELQFDFPWYPEGDTPAITQLVSKFIA